MSKKLNFMEIMKETGILTVAVAIIAAAVYFFLVPSHASVSSISGLGIVVSKCVTLPFSEMTMVALIDWICDLWKRIRNQNSIYKHYAAVIFRTF